MKREPPQRSCIGCRQVRAKAQLLRLVRRGDGMVVIDREGTAPGRGAYVCPAGQCLVEALKRGRLVRAFRATAEPSEELRALAASRR